MTPSRRRVAILISGRGSNMAALIDAARAPDYPAAIVGIISSRSDAGGLAIASAAGVATQVVSAKAHPGWAGQEATITTALERWDADIVCLAGYMRLLSPDFVERWRGRLINIHPALLPAFPGLDTHRRALAEGAEMHGCTVHFVTADMDAGPIIAQAQVPVLPGDTEETLAARVLEAEHRLYPAALRSVAAALPQLAPIRS